MAEQNSRPFKRGELNILFVGFPAYHPAVISQGWDPAKVDKGLKSQLEELVAAGYNTVTVWNGPERGIEPILEALKARRWDGVIVGFGVRGGNTLDVTIHFENIINGLRVHAPHARVMFNYNPTSTLEAVQRAFPLDESSTGTATNYVSVLAMDKPGQCLDPPFKSQRAYQSMSFDGIAAKHGLEVT